MGVQVGVAPVGIGTHWSACPGGLFKHALCFNQPIGSQLSRNRGKFAELVRLRWAAFDVCVVVGPSDMEIDRSSFLSPLFLFDDQNRVMSQSIALWLYGSTATVPQVRYDWTLQTYKECPCSHSSRLCGSIGYELAGTNGVWMHPVCEAVSEKQKKPDAGEDLLDLAKEYELRIVAVVSVCNLCFTSA